MIKNIIKQIYSFNIKEKLFFNPFIGFEISSLGNYQGVNIGIKRSIPVIVSLSATSDDYKNLPITLYSLLNQTMKPDRLILLISEDEDLQSLPYEITQFVKNGLEIRFVKNLNLYTTAYYAIKEAPYAVNLISKNGFFYNKNWLKNLYSSYIRYSDDIQVSKAIEIKYNSKEILSSKFWNKVTSTDAKYSYIMDLNEDMLLPPNCFSKDFLREDIFSKFAPTNPELWYWVMALVNGRKLRTVKNAIKYPILNNFSQLIKEKYDYDSIDYELKELLKFYNQNIMNKLS